MTHRTPDPETPEERTRRLADEAQAAAEEREAEKPAREWQEQYDRIADMQAGQMEKAAAMGDRVEESIPPPDPETDESPGVIAKRPPGEAREASTGKRDPGTG